MEESTDARRPDVRHARPPAGDRGAGRAHDRSAASGMVLHAGDYCSPFSLEPFHELEHPAAGVFGRNDGDHEGLKAYAAKGVGHRAVRVAAQLRGRRAAHPARARHRRRDRALARAHEIVVHGFTHHAGDEDARRHADRESRRGVRLAVRRARRRRSSTSRRSEVEFISASTEPEWKDVTRHEPDPDPRLRLAVHAAHRAARARGARVLRDSPADAHARVDPRVEADGDHPQRRPELGLRRGRADAPTASCSTSRRCSASATACSSSRTCRAARSIDARRSASTGAPRSWSIESRTGCSPASTRASGRTVWMSHGDHVDVPPPGLRRRPRAAAAVAVAAFRHETKPIYGVQFHPEVAHTPRGARDHRELPVRRLRRAADVDAGRVHRRRDRERSASWSATRA